MQLEAIIGYFPAVFTANYHGFKNLRGSGENGGEP